MGTVIRFIFSVPVALIVTILIFLGLYNQLSSDPFLYKTEKDPDTVYFSVGKAISPRVVCLDCGWVRVPEKPEISNTWTESSKAAKEAPHLSEERPEQITVKFYEIGFPADTEGQGDSYSSSLKYPEECVEKGASGVVTVRFDVAPEGNTENIRVIESADECFNSEVVRVVEGLEYTPAVDQNGKAMWRRDVTMQVTFERFD